MLTGAQTNLFKQDTCDNNLFLDILDDSNEKTEDKAVFFLVLDVIAALILFNYMHMNWIVAKRLHAKRAYIYFHAFSYHLKNLHQSQTYVDRCRLGTIFDHWP